MTEQLRMENAQINELVGPVITRATEVIGNREEAMRWLGTPVRALNFATRISLLISEEGQAAVMTVLGRLEHGIA